MSASGAYLIIRHDPTTEQEFPLSTDALTMGREAINEIILYDPEVSRQHVKISHQAGRYVVEDMGSTNGTFVNGRRVNKPTALHDGDLIEVGEAVNIIFRSSADAVDAVDRTTVEPPPRPPSELPPVLPGIEPDFAYAELPPPGEWEVGPTIVGPPPGVSQAAGSSDRRRLVLGAGCLVLAIIAICVATFFLLDALASDALYCGPFQSIFENLIPNLFCG